MSEVAVAKQDRLYQILVAPVVSEKSTLASENVGHVVFRVVPDATKAEVKSAVELAFDGVKVEKVQILVTKGKQKRFGAKLGRRNDVKKAYIRLAEGSDIDFSAFQG